MAEFFAAAFAMPTAVFSILLLICLLYWVIVLLGLLDLDIFDSLMGLDSADAIEGGGGFLSAMGLAGVPVIVSLSLFSFFGWIASYLFSQFLASALIALAGALLAAWMTAALAFACGLVVVIASAKPMRQIFAVPGGRSRESLVGAPCRISTLRVDDRYGQAEVDDGGAGLIIQVRCSENNTLTRGSAALIFDFDSQREIYKVVPLDEGDAIAQAKLSD